MIKNRQWVVLAVVMMLSLTFAAVVSAQGALVHVQENETFGPILVGPEGMTLYVFGRDEGGVSACYDQCAENWPPLVAESEDAIAGMDVPGEVGTTERTTGELQVTYNGMPLYYFAQDTQPGDTNGQGVGENWYVVPPDATSFAEARDLSEAAAGSGEEAAEEEETESEAEATTEEESAAESQAEAVATPATVPQAGGESQSTPLSVLVVGAGLLLLAAAFVFRQRQATL